MKSCAVLRLLLVLNRNLTLNPNRRWLPTGGRGCVVGIKIKSCLFEGLDCGGHLQPRSPDIGASSHFPTSIFLPTSSSGVGDHTTSDSMPRKRYFCGAKGDYRLTHISTNVFVLVQASDRTAMVYSVGSWHLCIADCPVSWLGQLLVL